MPVTVLVVDDSSFFRRRVVEILRDVDEIKVVGTASNGQEAIDKNKKLAPDVITMDYEMPLMDGITAIKHIMIDKPTAILMFSSLTFEGARVTLDALEAGALDFLPKSFESMSTEKVDIGRVLADRILAVAKKKDRRENLERSSDNLSRERAFLDANSGARSQSSTRSQSNTSINTKTETLSSRRPSVSASASTSTATSTSTVTSTSASTSKSTSSLVPSLLLIGASTGGPVAVQEVLKHLPANFPAPIVIIQHMPEAFTGPFAERLDQYCKIKVREARSGDRLSPGEALVAPGGQQMLVAASGGIRILASDERLQYKPSVDVTFGSAAKAMPGKILALVLTGMGADGREGAKILKRGNSRIWTQDEASCVVYGMPMAVKNAELSDQEVKIADMGRRLVAEFKCGST